MARFGRAFPIPRFIFKPALRPVVISGTATLNGLPLENAKITLIDSTTNLIVSTTLTDASGEYVFSGLSMLKTYHVAAEYEDLPDKYNAKSLPFVTPVEL